MTKQRTGKPGWGKAPKVRADAKLKNLSEEDQEEMWLMLHPVDPLETPALSADQVMLHAQDEYGVSVAQSSFYEWRSWWESQRQIIAARKMSDHFKEELAKDPDASATHIEKMGKVIFASQMVKDGNIKGFVALAKLRLAQEKLDQDARRIALLEKAAEERDKIKGVMENGKLSPEEKEATIRTIFRMG